MQDSVELEVAVTRARKYVLRAVFRSGATVTVGRDPGAVLHFDLPEAPELHEIFQVGGPRNGLCITRDMRVEIARDGRMLGAWDLEQEGLAVQDSDALRVPLEVGLKGLVRFGAMGVLFKVQPARTVPVRRLAPGASACAACDAELRHVLRTPPALTPCAACGVLNSFAPDDGPATEDFSEDDVEDTVSDLGSPARESLWDEVAPFDDLSTGSGIPAADPSEGVDLPTFDAIEAKKALDLPTFDAIEAKKALDPPTLDAIEAEKALDLPTFDAIEAKKALDLPTFDAIDAKKALDLPTFDAIEVNTPAGGGRRGGFASLGGAVAKGADLPTFDAISVVREQGFSTQAAISVMKTEPTDDEPGAPVQLGPAVTPLAADSEAPAPGAELESMKTMPAVARVQSPPRALARGGAELPDDPVEAIKQQAGLNTDAAIELMRGGSSTAPPTRATGEITASRPQPTRPPEPDLFSEAFEEITSGDDEPKTAREARGVSMPNVNAVPLVTETNSVAPVDGGDDFLMGRTDLDPSEIVGKRSSGLVLYAIGFASGLIGIVLILMRLLG